MSPHAGVNRDGLVAEVVRLRATSTFAKCYERTPALESASTGS